jgi:hypothetical protein
MISASWYHSNFDEGPGLWQPAADATPTGYLDGDENEWGGVFDQYLSRTTGNCDRAISIYRSAQSSMAYWELTLTNDTGLEIIGLVIRYDLELEWSRFQGTDSLGADYGIRSERFAWYLGGVPGVLATSPYLSTPTVDAALMQRWLSDAEMDAAGLAVRGVSHQVTGLSLAPGVAFTLRFGMEVTGTTNQNKNVNLGIDNLEIDPVHP